MTSQPSDPRPDPFINFGGGQSYVLAEGRVPACSPSVLEAEQGVFRQLAASTPQPTLEVCPFARLVLFTFCVQYNSGNCKISLFAIVTLWWTRARDKSGIKAEDRQRKL